MTSHVSEPGCSGKLRALLRVRLLGDSRPIGARISRGKVDLAAAVPDNGRALSNGKGERFEELDLMASLCETRSHLRRDGLLHLNVAAIEGFLGKARLFECRLDVHAVIDDVSDELRVSLRLVPAPHDAEADVDVSLLHEGGNDGVEGTLVSASELGSPGVS
jgi:hypothetical protein